MGPAVVFQVTYHRKLYPPFDTKRSTINLLKENYSDHLHSTWESLQIDALDVPTICSTRSRPHIKQHKTDSNNDMHFLKANCRLPCVHSILLFFPSTPAPTANMQRQSHFFRSPVSSAPRAASSGATAFRPPPPARPPPGHLRPRHHLPASNSASSSKALGRARRSRSSVEPHGATIFWLHLLRSAPESGNSGAPFPEPRCCTPFGRAPRGAGAGAPFGALPNRAKIKRRRMLCRLILLS